jgi:peroxiredoxin
MNDDLKPLPPGTRAPDFSLPRTHFASVALSDLHGNPAVLVFYPGDWEPVSRHQLVLYQEYLPELQRFGAALIGISIDSIWSHAAFGQALGLTFPLLSDFHARGKVARTYGVFAEEEGRSGRALFVLDRESVVRWSRSYLTNFDPGVHGILSALEALRADDTTQ